VAACTTSRTGVTFTLELSEAEAQYVRAALGYVNPTRLDGDTVWEALYDAMREADVPHDSDAAERT